MSERGAEKRDASILMVDDEPTTLDAMEMFLRADGYQHILKNDDARLTLALIQEGRPDVTLLNLRMPHVSGLDVLRSMRRDASLRDLPVILVTSSSDPDTKQQALEAGATDFLRKPVDPQELSLRVANALAARSRREGFTAPPRPTASLEGPIRSRLASDERARRILVDFVGRLEAKLVEMEASFEGRRLDDLVGLAHWLKGAAGTVGFDAFTEPAERLRQMAREGKLDDIAPLLDQLRDLWGRIEIGELAG